MLLYLAAQLLPRGSAGASSPEPWLRRHGSPLKAERRMQNAVPRPQNLHPKYRWCLFRVHRIFELCRVDEILLMAGFNEQVFIYLHSLVGCVDRQT
ncbi:hypothetical protein B0J15DRAFT_477718 [Fusarium solani]|uniref:Uncharacterized protein n=1 Tax=Fusarium solani TaxID=169388 RepID=A0A9P9L3V4_FUSSL|nr:uncharacterized protein B0J15DRAFT_477718 [Fusarium solani]KAH7273661.1 hypothetical protein B0J15DRAFT_477718 [Fusarium solani]